MLHLIEVIQKLHNNNLSWNVAEVGGGGDGAGERLILNLLDNELSFQPNAFVTRNYHSLGGGSLEKLGGGAGLETSLSP